MIFQHTEIYQGTTLKVKKRPVCEDGTDTTRLDLCQKNVFLGHRRFLNSNHHYRGWRKSFNGKAEQCRAPPILTCDQIFEKVKDVSTQFGKPFAHTLVKSGWKKRSIFLNCHIGSRCM